MPSAKREEDDDPVSVEYDIFITPKLAEQLYLLQFPLRSREMPYNTESRNTPLELRLKPMTGFIEMDVPLNTQMYYDRSKADGWGEALAKSKSAGAKGHGIAVGFSQGNSGGRSGLVQPGPDSSDDHLDHQTLGGQLIHGEQGKPNYMIGTFLTDKRELHLTALDGVVQMRPQFHHLDAERQVERNRARQARNVDTIPKEAQHVQMNFVDSEQVETVSTKDLLEKAQNEPWKRMRFYDEEEAHSYESYNGHLFLDEDQKKVELVAALDNEKYLEAMSAPRLDQFGKPKVKPITKRQKVQIDLSDDDIAPPEA